MNAVDLVRKKRDGHELSDTEIDAFVHGATQQTWTDYQLSAMLMAIFLRGMTARETARLTRAMVASGDKLDWSDLGAVAVDKHSTGGVGDKTSLILAPLAAARGCVVPMMSGRGLGHSGGTLDKLEAIPGFRVDLSVAELRTAIEKNGCALIGQTKEIAPADKILYSLRDVTATVESIPLITGSIMSKKIAEGIKGLVLDVKCGQGAFMKTRDDAKALAMSLVENGHANDVRTVAYVTAMDHPLGRAVGNSLEVIECLETLKGNGPKDLENMSVLLAARMLCLSRAELTLEQSLEQIRDVLSNGQGLAKFADIIEQQGGDPHVGDDYDLLPIANNTLSFKAEQGGYVMNIHAERIGRAAMMLGAGRKTVTDKIEPSVGVVMSVDVGDKVAVGEELAKVYYMDENHLADALSLLRAAFMIGESAPTPSEQILETIGVDAKAV